MTTGCLGDMDGECRADLGPQRYHEHARQDPSGPNTCVQHLANISIHLRNEKNGYYCQGKDFD